MAALNGNNVDLLVKLKSGLVGLLVKEEKTWQQRSIVHWMKSVDKNSSYFHNKASQQFRTI